MRNNSLLAKEIKKMIMDSGADLCGIASVERFDDAPSGFHPCWNYAYGGENGGSFKIKCFKCREICPNCLGEN